MGRPTVKPDLLAAADAQFAKLWNTLEGGMPDVPGAGYAWKILPDFNREIWKKYQRVPLHEAKEMLRQSPATVFEGHTNEKLFVKGAYKWTKSSTLGAYFVSATSSHCDWAMKS